MSPRELTRRAFAHAMSRAIAAAALGWAALTPATARASLFGEENASLLAILANAIEQLLQAYKTVDGVFQSVGHLKNVVQHGITTLEHIKNIDDLVSVLEFALDAIHSLQNIDRDVTKLGYKIDAIDSQYRNVFPTRASLESKPEQDFVPMARGWNDALGESTVVAVRAQTSIETLQARAQKQKDILDASKNSDGVVAQLQAVVTGLALLHSDLASLELNLAAGMRVTTAWAGKQAASESLVEENNRRMMDGYTDEDPPGEVLTELP